MAIFSKLQVATQFFIIFSFHEYKKMNIKECHLEKNNFPILTFSFNISDQKIFTGGTFEKNLIAY